MTDQLPVTYRGMANIWHCDEMGHLNVRYYLDKGAQAVEHFFALLGMGPEKRTAANVRLDVRGHHLRFLAEARPGTALYATTGVVNITDDALDLVTVLYHLKGDHVCATLTQTIGLADADDSPAPLPVGVLEKAKAFETALPDFAAPKGIDVPAPTQVPDWQVAEDRGLEYGSLNVYAADQANPEGVIAQHHLLGGLLDGMSHLFAKAYGALGREEMLREGVGGAALEYRMFNFKPARPGMLMEARSGVTELGNKTIYHAHWMFDAETKEPIASVLAIAVSFDLKARKAIEIPDALRRGYQALLAEGHGI